jgi:hypothetical protein
VAITHVVLYPEGWNVLTDAARSEYIASAEARGIALRIAYPATTNPNQVVTVSDSDFTAIDAPYYLGPARCGRSRWEHKLREILNMDDPCFQGGELWT